jgi:curved DNA-binding protein
MDFKDYYATLGVAKTASDKEIKQAFRKLARKFHPDVNPGSKAAEAKFKEINEAHEVLGDPTTRKKYDELGSNWKLYEQGRAPSGPGPFSGGWTPPDGRGGGFRAMTPEEMEAAFGDSSPFSDFFTTFFGGGAPRGTASRSRQRAGRDVEHEIQLSLEEAFTGTTRRLRLSRDGDVRQVDVRIPAGVGDGSRVRVAGEGEPGLGGTSAGHLFLRVRIARHATFERKDRDLHVTVPLPVTIAVLGGQADVQTLGGKSARLRVPPLTQNGQVFRLKGYGMPSTSSDGERGDLYARVEIRLPAELSPQEREHYTALARLFAEKAAAVP